MSWDDRVLTDNEVALYTHDQASGPLLDRVDGLIRHQQATWPLLAKGIEGLSQVEFKEFISGNFTLLAQHNPQRIISTTALVDRESVRHRACFLCAENLPPEERGIAFGEDFIILCNPYPIVERHLSIVHREHRPQTIIGHLETMLELAAGLSPKCFILYNGPRCGASAPDHLHFQAGARAILPIEEHLRTNQKESAPDQIVKLSEDNSLRVPNYHIPTLLLRGSNKRILNQWFNEMVGLLAQLTKQKGEPLLNLIAFADQVRSNQPGLGSTLWTVIVFPRSKHRPDCYFADGAEKLTVSPAALDLAGLVVVPVREHFDRITSSDVQQILTEVTLDQDVFAQLATALTKSSPLRDITQN